MYKLKLLINPNLFLNKISKPIPEKCLVFGNTLYLQKKGPQFKELATHKIWEKETTEYFLENISKDSVALDIGANIGYFTALFAKLVEKNGKVFAFEPELSNFTILQKNVRTNNYQNVVIENSAVTDFTGKTKLYLSETAAGQHRIYHSNEVSNNTVSIRTIKLDDYFHDSEFFHKISFIKIDVEGAELAVLKGMEKIILNNRKMSIVLEFSPQQLRDYGDEPIELLNYLGNLGFKFYSLIDKKNERKELIDKNLIIKNFEGSAKNLLCIKE